MNLRIANQETRADSVMLKVEAVDDSDPDNPKVVAERDFVFSYDTSIEDAAQEMQREFVRSAQQQKGVERLAEEFPVGREFPVADKVALRRLLSLT